MRSRRTRAVTVVFLSSLMAAFSLALGMRNAECGVRNRGPNDASSTPYSALRIPHSAFQALQEIAQSLSERWHSPVLLDPEIGLTSAPRAPGDGLPIDQALTALCASVRDVAWRRIYRPRGAGEEALSPDALGAAARALDQREQGSLLIVDADSKRVTSFLKEDRASPSFHADLERRGFDPEALYLLYSTAAPRDGRTPERRFADLQQRQLQLPVADEHLALAAVQTLQFLQAMAPADREAFAGLTLQAGMQEWDTTPPQQRQEMIQQTFRLMASFRAPDRDVAAKGAGPLRPVPRNYLPELKTLTRRLSSREESTVLVDRAIFLAAPLAEQDASLPLEPSLDALCRPLKGLAWRRVYVTEAQLGQLKRVRAIDSLVGAVRLLDSLDTGSLALKDAATRRTTVYLKAQPLTASFDREREAAGLSARPVYVVYGTDASDTGGTVEERSADLQRQQMGLMLRMSREGMARSMEQLIQSYPTLDPAAQRRLLGLPMMAGMMAVWFPREAKERQERAGASNR